MNVLTIEMYRTLPTDLTSYCILSSNDLLQWDRRRGLTTLVFLEKLSNQEKAEEFQKVIDRHPQVGTSSAEIGEKQNQVHYTYVFEYKDDNNNVYVEKQLDRGRLEGSLLKLFMIRLTNI